MKIRWIKIRTTKETKLFTEEQIKMGMVPIQRHKLIFENAEPEVSNMKVKLAFSVLEWSPNKRLNEPWTNYWGFELFNSYLMNDPVSFETKEEVEEYILENWNNKR